MLKISLHSLQWGGSRRHNRYTWVMRLCPTRISLHNYNLFENLKLIPRKYSYALEANYNHFMEIFKGEATIWAKKWKREKKESSSVTLLNSTYKMYDGHVSNVRKQLLILGSPLVSTTTAELSLLTVHLIKVGFVIDVVKADSIFSVYQYTPIGKGAVINEFAKKGGNGAKFLL